MLATILLYASQIKAKYLYHIFCLLSLNYSIISSTAFARSTLVTATGLYCFQSLDRQIHHSGAIFTHILYCLSGDDCVSVHSFMLVTTV